MKIDYIVDIAKNSKKLVMIAENEAEKCQLEILCNCIGIDWNYRHVELTLERPL